MLLSAKQIALISFHSDRSVARSSVLEEYLEYKALQLKAEAKA
jgi:hypothetical protein